MRVDIPKDNPNMICQAVPLQSQSMVSNHPDQMPLQSSVTVHRHPPGPITSHHRGPGPPPVPNANATQGPPPAPRSAHMTPSPSPRPPVRDPQTAIHGAATEALDLRVIKQRDSGEGG
ncbi:unnamed protein product [Pleuronectes platessa]|uniref:Uncharacterized protein n=1 Tax=Pleuronectes platessa TaxID=8262 RepID=A0A9N7YT44_PLEPL|nr:unnamed protein product [Pleuronectes platessa]